jgi:Cu2+-exporting ATPase
MDGAFAARLGQEGAGGEGTSRCAHCGAPLRATGDGPAFCCRGCAEAYRLIHEFGLGRYYAERVIAEEADLRPPAAGTPADLGPYLRDLGGGRCGLELAVEGLSCGACVWLIEEVLARDPATQKARVNLTTRRLQLEFEGGAEVAARLSASVERLGYRLVPFDSCLAPKRDEEQRRLLRALAVAGFAAGNVMLLALASWVGGAAMGPATRGLLRWLSALIALPAIAYAGAPFFGAALRALAIRRVTMDVPIALGLLAVSALSLIDAWRGVGETYFESGVMLLFFLLAGRVLDRGARARARAELERALALQTRPVTVLLPEGGTRLFPAESVPVGAQVLVGVGERFGVDGVVLRGVTEIDASALTGESQPLALHPGERVEAGALNLGAPVVIRAERVGGETLLAQALRLIEEATAAREERPGLADRAARIYTPGVHILALATLIGWGAAGAGWGVALTHAASVLLVTCPCALALAVPAARLIAHGAILRRGILLKTPDALERLAAVDTVVFDKTGTLTDPGLWREDPALAGREAELARAAGLARASRHPLAKALAAAFPDALVPEGEIAEEAGAGLLCRTGAGEMRLGSAAFCAIPPGEGEGPELCFTAPGRPPLRLRFTETPRPGAEALIAHLRERGIAVWLASGDGAAAVERLGARLGLPEDAVLARLSPLAKAELLARLAGEGRRVLMVGDGINDGAALARAHAALSPAAATDLAQVVADGVVQGRSLLPIADLLALAQAWRRVVRQNLGASLLYNALAVPLAVFGFVAPWLAAAAMSASSIVVVLNSLRLARVISSKEACGG